jgi:starch phosphorylase
METTPGIWMALPEIRRRPAPELEIPELFGRLRDIVYNLWWTWSPDAHRLFYHLSPAAWRHYRNPIDVLIDLGPERWRALQDDDDFARAYHALVKQFDAYMSPARPTWFERTHGGYGGGSFVYFCSEFGWHECLHIYSGGLGVLAGDHCKSASDLGLPFVGVGLMYKHGYFRQSIDAEGLQQHFYPDYDLHRLPLLQVMGSSGKELYVPIAFPGRAVQVRVWCALVGRVPVLLLDSDLPINHPADRPLTSVLYVRGREMRLCQEIVLGLGGALTLEALGITPSVWHINEGHSALLALHRARRLIERERRPLDAALRSVAANTLFTTHTPVPAGNESFDADLVRKYFAGWAEQAGIDIDELLRLGRTPGGGNAFNLTALALRASSKANGVSELHGKVANRMWRPLLDAEGLRPIEHITNGVHPPTWVGPDVREVLDKHLGPAFGNGSPEDGFAEGVEAIPDYELWAAHLAQKRRLIKLLREQTLEQYARHGRSPDALREVDHLMDPDALTVGFARRFATYKRADLLLRNPDRLRALVSDAERPVQFIFAGKAHPADRPGQDLIRRICQASLAKDLRGRMIFLESYDLRIARHLVQGVDLWLNTPRRPHEASGTSGMKAAANGVLNCSILDGWWCEGHDPSHGWVIGSTEDREDESDQDRHDADALYRVLLDEIAPAYYERNEHGLPAPWIRRMKRSIALLTPRFSTTRMVREYVGRYYLAAPAGQPEGPASSS